MAKPISSAPSGANKPHNDNNTRPTRFVNGVLQHPLINAETQVRILARLDPEGSVAIDALAAALTSHPDPLGAIFALVDVGLLDLDNTRLVDQAAHVRRASPDPENRSSKAVTVAAPAEAGGGAVPDGLGRLDTGPFAAEVFFANGAERRAFGRKGAPHGPGIYGLMNAHQIYIGMGSDLGDRIANGDQKISPVTSIFAIADRNGALSAKQALVAERILWSRAMASGERAVVNQRPNGTAIDWQRYTDIVGFVVEACLTLRRNRIYFVTGSARSLLAGPVLEPGLLAPPRAFDAPPPGDILELRFGRGFYALAARQSEDYWILLKGSHVRPKATRSGNTGISFLRAACVHAGMMIPSADGKSYVMTRDMAFMSGSSVAQFCSGGKGMTVADWQPIDPDGGIDPATAARVAA